MSNSVAYSPPTYRMRLDCKDVTLCLLRRGKFSHHPTHFHFHKIVPITTDPDTDSVAKLFCKARSTRGRTVKHENDASGATEAPFANLSILL
ncbi:hypothetical protein PM082_017072 [Marasmius tenuissimus]|nr:hypothetical protein PM082_017072 [Marasmius tenuissimus]